MAIHPSTPTILFLEWFFEAGPGREIRKPSNSSASFSIRGTELAVKLSNGRNFTREVAPGTTEERAGRALVEQLELIQRNIKRLKGGNVKQEFVVTILETQTKTGRAFQIKTDAAMKLTNAFSVDRKSWWPIIAGPDGGDHGHDETERDHDSEPAVDDPQDSGIPEMLIHD